MYVHVQVAEEVVRRTKVLKWILTRLKPREFDSNKQAASEVLTLLLQTNPDTIGTRLAQYNGIDTCLQVCNVQHYMC
jgi:beta-catenin-like protein 1